MIIVQLMGGLGNQLQQYALYKHLESEGIDVRLDVSWFDESRQKNMAAPRRLELSDFGGISYVTPNNSEVSKLIGSDDIRGKIRRKLFKNSIKVFDENGRIYVPELIDGILSGRTKDLYLRGYFACDYYYASILPKIRDDIDFNISENGNYPAIQKIANDMSKTESVSIHLRRGDYLDSINQEMFGGICTDRYYEGCIGYFIEKMAQNTELTFFIFSDDISYAHEFAAKMRTSNHDLPIMVVDVASDGQNNNDMYLMSRCKHNITANSTFSFWGARLNNNIDKIVFRPTKHRNDHIFEYEEMKKLWKGWNFCDPEGKLYLND